MNVEEILKELSNKISEVYNLELAKELTDIYVNLADQIREDDHKYFELVRKSAELEVEKDKYKGGYGRVWEAYKRAKEAFKHAKEAYKEELLTKGSMEESFNVVTELAKEMVEKERKLREGAEKERDQAEYDKEYYAKELEEEWVSRSHLEDVKEYYRMQIRKNCIFDGERNRDFGNSKKFLK